MKAIFNLLAVMFLAASAQAQTGITLGDLALGGTACRLGGVGPIQVSIEDGKLLIPAASIVRMSTSDSLQRGTCMFTLPVQLEPGYRLVLRDVSAMGDLSLSKGVHSQIDLEIFAAGSQGPQLTSKDGSNTSRVRKSIELGAEGEILVTGCGESLNLRGNSSILLTGQSSRPSNAAVHLIEMAAEIQKCE